MGMSGMYGPADRAESLATLKAAVDAGINLISEALKTIGARSRERLAEALSSGDIALTAARGDRYPSVAMAQLDSER